MAKYVAKKNQTSGTWCVYEKRSVNSFELVRECDDADEANRIANKMNRAGEEA